LLIHTAILQVEKKVSRGVDIVFKVSRMQGMG
jgi:hypothetical protein